MQQKNKGDMIMDNLKQWLLERKNIYFMLSLLYTGRIEKGLQILNESNLLHNFANYTDNEYLSIAASKVIQEIEENKNNNYINLIIDDYQRLFVGPDKILAPLWESVYKTKDKLLFGYIELEVRRYYNSVGLDVKKSEPADFLPIELLFMSRLSQESGKENLEIINECLDKQLNFLKEHLLSWIPLWTEDVNQNAEMQFWKGISQITKRWLEIDLRELKMVNNNIEI